MCEKMQEKVLQIEIKNDIIKFHRKKRLDKNILETPKKIVDNGRRTCYYKRVACEETGRSKEAKRTLTSEQQCNPENSKRDFRE